MEKTLETAHGQFLLRPYRDEDEEKVITLWEAAFNQKMDKRIWRWKFQDNPFGRQIMLCLTEEGLPVAMYSGIPYRANWQGKEVRFTQLIDNMSHPDHRFSVQGRKGLYALTVDHFVEIYGWPKESLISYGFPGLKHFKLGKMFFEYQDMGGGGVYLKADSKKLKSANRFSLRKTEIADQADGFFDKLQNSLTGKYPFAAIGNRQFIQWRFFDHPFNKYFIFTGKSFSGQPLSYLALSISENTATIVDIFGFPDKKEAVRLIVGALKTLKNHHLKNIQTWLPAHHFLTKELLEAGFQKHPEPIGLIPTVRIYHPDLLPNYIDDHIFYTMADGDLF